MERCRVITVSDRSAGGERPDLSGPALVRELTAAGYAASLMVVPDGQRSVRDALRTGLIQGARVLITTGGTGVGPRDSTPEGTREVIDRMLPGVGELLRARGAATSIHASLSRGIVGVVDSSRTTRGAFIANLPGNPQAALEGLAVLLPLIPHVLDQLVGGDH